MGGTSSSSSTTRPTTATARRRRGRRTRSRLASAQASLRRLVMRKLQRIITSCGGQPHMMIRNMTESKYLKNPAQFSKVKYTMGLKQLSKGQPPFDLQV